MGVVTYQPLCRLQVPLHVKEALEAEAAAAAGADDGGGEAGIAEALRFPLALGPARVEAGEPPPAHCRLFESWLGRSSVSAEEMRPLLSTPRVA